MSDPALQPLGDGRFRLTGDLDFVGVPQLLDASTTLFAPAAAHVVVDLGGVNRTTSVGLALMVEWRRQAQRFNKTVEFQNVPAQMLAMAKVSGLDIILMGAAKK